MKTLSTITTFNCDISFVANMIDKIVSQRIKCIIIDNASSNQKLLALLLSKFDSSQVEFWGFEENLGLGAAANAAINFALRNSYDYIVTFDQDTEIPTNYFASLQHEFARVQRIVGQNQEIASLSPNIIEPKLNRQTLFVIFGFLAHVPAVPDNDNLCYPEYITASGTMYALSAMKKIGGFDEKLFIDLVDIEWAQRAKYHDLLVVGTYSINIRHSIGDNLKMLRGKAYPIHSDFRRYYMTRNSIYLSKKSHISIKFKIIDLTRLCVRLPWYVLNAQSKRNVVKYILQGIIDGIRGRMGRRAFN
jgi:rhamnosyltransferase